MNAMEIVIEIIPLNKKWIVNICLDQTLQENLKQFFKIVNEEVRDQYLYSEQMVVIESQSGQHLDPFITCESFRFYTGILLYVI